MTSSLLEDYLLILFFFVAWSILFIIVPYFFKCLGVDNNKCYQLVFFVGILIILSIIIKKVQNDDECKKEELRINPKS